MGFPKAIQNIAPEAYTKLVEEKLIHSAEKKLYYKLRGMYMNSDDPMDQLKFYKAKERHSLACQRIYQAQEEYKRAVALVKLKEKGYDVSTTTLARLAEIEIPTSMKELVRQAQQDNNKAIVMLDPEARELIRQLQTPEIISLKEQFKRELDDIEETTIPDGPLTIEKDELF